MRNFLAFILTLILVPLGIILTVSWVSFSLISQPTVLKSILNEQHVYSQIPSLATPYFNLRQSGINLSASELDRFLKASLPDDTLRSLTETNIDVLHNWLTGRSDAAALQFDLTRPKSLAKDELAKVLNEQYSHLSTCSANDLLPSSTLTSSQFPSCRRASESQLANRLAHFDANQLAGQVLHDIPDTYSYTIPASGRRIPSAYQTITLSLQALTLLVLILTGLLAIILWPRPGQLIRRSGLILILIGLPIAAGTYFGSELLQEELYSLIVSPGTQLAPTSQNTINGFLAAIIHHWRDNLYLAAGLMAAIGIAAIFTGFFLPNRPTRRRNDDL